MPTTATFAAQAQARQLRRTPSKAEGLLWWALRRNQLGVRFRRQHAAGPFILDFYCATAKLCVEVDGEQHDRTTGRDLSRDDYLRREFGLRTVRVSNADVLTNLSGVVDFIRSHLEAPSLG